MKFNLKNRPFISIIDIISTPISESTFNKIKEYIDINEAWFEGFEKELRERLTQLEQGKRKTDNAVVIASRLSLTYMIKEILGES